MGAHESITPPRSGRLYSPCWRRRNLWRPLDYLLDCPKMWLSHALYKTQGFCIAIPVTPYLLLILEYSNTSVYCSAVLSLTFYLFVLDSVFQPSLPSLHLGIKQTVTEAQTLGPASICPSVYRGHNIDLQLKCPEGEVHLKVNLSFSWMWWHTCDKTKISVSKIDSLL